MKTVVVLALCALGAALASDDAAAVKADGAAPPPFKMVPFREMPGPAHHVGHNVGIYNGGIAERSQFPFQAGIYIDFGSFCGGSLIHKKWVLTAAHCVDGGQTWTVSLGLSSMAKGKEDGRVVHVSNWAVRHEDYNARTIINDIGVIQLRREAVLNEFVKLVTLAPAGVNYAGQTATISGFGLIDDSNTGISPVLRYTSMPVVSNQVCYAAYGASDVSQICLQAKGTSSCSGDSGGPLTVPDSDGSVIQIALTSFGCQNGCTVGCPVGYTRVNYFLDWLSKTTGVNFP